MNPFDIFNLIIKAVDNDRAFFFYDARAGKKSCLISDLVFEFEEQEEGSLVVRNQNLVLLWMRETPGWEEISNRLSLVVEDQNSDSSEVRRKIFLSIVYKLSNL